MKRSGKFYRKNEEEVMKLFGFDPTPNSGSGWVVKEDGQNESVICQLKSTDANSIRINKLDLDKLIVHSITEKKLPVFAIQFLQSNEVFLVVRPEDLQDVSEYIKTGKVNEYEQFIATEQDSTLESVSERYNKENRIIKSSTSAREAFMNECMERYAKERKSAL